MKKIKINGNEYNAKDFDINTICDFEDMGLQLEEIGDKEISFARAYIALCMDCDIEKAGKEMQNHIVNGGKLKDIFEIMQEKIEESGFFQQTKENAEEDAPESKE